MKGALGAGIVTEVGLTAGGAEIRPEAEHEPASKPRIMFYHDSRHPLFYMYEPPMQKEECEAAVDELAGTPVEALMFCLGDGRTMMHDTQVGELWGHNVDTWTHQIFRRTYQNAQGLIEQGHDPLRVVCDRAHDVGILLYPTLLMQLESGVRGGGGYDIRSSDFRLDNKHLDIGGSANVDRDFPGFHCADFKHRKVRDERFAIIEEVLIRYPVDGIELQLNFWPYYFHPDEIQNGRRIMTEWIARVFDAVKRSGPERELVISIPAGVDFCLSRGLDPLEWINRGIVDVLVAHKPAHPELMDPNGTFLVYEGWLLDDIGSLVEAARSSNCRVHAAIDSHIDSDRLAEAPIEMIRAAACSFWDRGVSGLYVSQWHGNWPYDATFYEKLRELPHPDIMASRDKFYHIPTTAGRFNNPELTRQLPVKLEVNRPVDLELDITDDLTRWDDSGRVHEVLLRFRIMNTTELDWLKFRLNGEWLPETSLRKINQMYRMSAPRYRTGSGYWFIFRLDRDHWPRIGRNRIEVLLARRDPDLIDDVFVRDVELEIKYLMGKNFHRGQDPDLGSAKSSGG